jgi:hypothetical protein
MVWLIICVAIVCAVAGWFHLNQVAVLRKVIERLTADTRIAQVVVTDTHVAPGNSGILTTIKFTEYDSRQRPLVPQYFTFSGNLLQFESLVIRFDDRYVKYGHALKGKSAAIFLKIYCLIGNRVHSYDINKYNEVPSGYRISKGVNPFERRLWEEFWHYAFSPRSARAVGIKNAQIEAPGTKFIPGYLYTLRLEHDGGIRIDVQPDPRLEMSQR